MKHNRSELRELVMVALYQIALYKKNNISYQVESVIKENLEVDNDFAKDFILGVLDRENELDLLANKYLVGWTVDRLGTTDQVILRMGIYELLYTDTPDLVCINEAIELARKFSDDDVRKMINGVLDKVYHSKE